MAQLLVRNLDASLVRKLKLRAAAHGVSAEEEHRRILKDAFAQSEERKPSLIEFLVSLDGEYAPGWEFPDALFRRAKLAAAERQVTLRELMTEALERALDGGPAVARRMVSPPVSMTLAPSVPAMSGAEMATVFDEGDVLKAGV